jgi:hypothetical protein
MSPISERFGFLPVNRRIEFNGGTVEPLPQLAQLIPDVWAMTHRDGHVYPPTENNRALNVIPPRGNAVTRPALLHGLPASHTLTVSGSVVDPSPRGGDAAFLIHFVGFMLGYRVQFEGWWFDGRVPMGGRRWSILPERQEGDLLSMAHATWSAWQEPERKRFTNLLYMHGRSFSYEWDWEQFAVRYMVLDGCYRMAEELGLLNRVSHRERINAMLGYFGMPSDSVTVEQIVRLRNDLFHETLWDRGQPATGSHEGPLLANAVHRVNDRLLWALAGYRGTYLAVPWWGIGQALI